MIFRSWESSLVYLSCVLETCRAHCISKLHSSEKHIQLCCVSEVIGTIRNWCSVIQVFKQCNGRFRYVSLAKVLVSLHCSGMKLQSWTSEFCKVSNSAGCSLAAAGVFLHILSSVCIFNYNS